MALAADSNPNCASLKASWRSPSFPSSVLDILTALGRLKRRPRRPTPACWTPTASATCRARSSCTPAARAASRGAPRPSARHLTSPAQAMWWCGRWERGERPWGCEHAARRQMKLFTCTVWSLERSQLCCESLKFLRSPPSGPADAARAGFLPDRTWRTRSSCAMSGPGAWAPRPQIAGPRPPRGRGRPNLASAAVAPSLKLMDGGTRPVATCGR